VWAPSIQNDAKIISTFENFANPGVTICGTVYVPIPAFQESSEYFEHR